MINKHLPIALLVLAGLLLAGASLGFSKNINRAANPSDVILAEHRQSTDPENFKQPEVKDPFTDLSIIARSAIVLDAKTGEIIYAKNIHERLPLASITKVMTMLVADDLIDGPQNTLVTIKEEDLEPEGDSGLLVGQTWKIKDLMNFSLIVSSNDGARAIAGVAGATSGKDFITAMNDRAVTLNLEKTTFKNESGLDLANFGGASAQGSVENVARLFAYIYNTKPELLEATKQANASVQPINGDYYFASNTNDAINQIPGLIASKTGYTDLSGGNLAVTFDRGLNQPAIAVVLASTQQGRFEDIVKLTRASVESLQITLNTNNK